MVDIKIKIILLYDSLIYFIYIFNLTFIIINFIINPNKILIILILYKSLDLK